MKSRRGPSRGNLLAAALATTLSCGLVCGAVQAQSPAPAAEQAQGTTPRQFAIPAQPLGTALMQFAQQSGWQVSAHGDLVQGKTSAGVSGTMTPEQAIARLLAGTGLSASVTAGNTVTVTTTGAALPGAMQLDPVQVQGAFPVPPQAMIDNLPPPYAGGQVATGGQLGLLGNRPVMDTPFNQTSYTAKKAQDQQAKSVREVLVDDPSVRPYFQDGGPGSDAVRIRGFNVLPGTYLYGGLSSMLPFWMVMPELAERVEVLKGPSAMLTGMAPNNNSLGGTVNIVPKRAPNEDLTQITANYASAGQFGAHADIGRRFGSDKEFGVRFNGAFRGGSTPVENNTDTRALAVLGLDFRGDRVRLAADLGYQYQIINWVVPYLGVNNGVPLPWAPSAYKNLGQPWGVQQRKDLFGVVRGEVDLTERVTAFAAFGAHDNRANGLYAAQVNATNFNGTALASAPINFSQYQTFVTAEAGARALVDTGPIGHEFALTATTLLNDSGVVTVQGTTFATNFYNPVGVAQPNLATPNATKTASQTLSSWGIADTLSAAEKRVQLTVGARLQQVTAANFNPTTGAVTSSYDQNALSPSVALVVKPFWDNVSFYANWIQGLQRGSIVGSTFTNAGEVFPPFKTTQYEAGIKVDWGKLTTTASIFQISQPSILTNVANNTQFLGGEQLNQGLEFNFFGEITEGVRVLGGAMFLNAVLTKTQGGLTDGWIAPFSPGAQFNLAGEWDLPFARSLTLASRITYTGAQYIDTTSPRRELPEWTRLDLGVRYAFDNPGAKGKLLVARFNVDNVLGSNYWAGGDGPTFLMLGAPRTFRLSLTADF